MTRQLIRLGTLTAALIALGTTALPAHAGGHYKSQKTSHNMQKADIVDTAVQAGSFKTLIAAVQAAGLENVLRGDGPYTVFAPTDAAFAKLPAGTVDRLLKPENKHKLADILTYHVVSGTVKARDITGKKSAVASVQGESIFVDGRNGVRVDNASVIQADIKTSNGIIHAIDSVIMP